MASGYRWSDGRLSPGARISVFAQGRGDVGVVSTVRDLARWDRGLRAGKILSAAARRTMFSPARLADGTDAPYGFGWFLTPFHGELEEQHDGAFRTGYGSSITRYPGLRLTIILLGNRRAFHPYTMVRAIAGLLDERLRPLSAMTPQSDPAPKRTRAALEAIRTLCSPKPASIATFRKLHVGWLSPGKEAEVCAGADRLRFVAALPLGARIEIELVARRS